MRATWESVCCCNRAFASRHFLPFLSGLRQPQPRRSSASRKREPRLEAIEQRLDAMLRAIQTVQPALEKFYGALSDEQKERFNRVSPAQG